jgi:hypothetical protein
MRSVPLTHTAIASGVSNTFRQVGAVFGVALAAAVFATAGSYRTPGEFVDGLRPAFVALSAVCAASATLGVLIWRSDRNTDATPSTLQGSSEQSRQATETMEGQAAGHLRVRVSPNDQIARPR